MRLKKKKITRDTFIQIRCKQEEKNVIQSKANLYTEGNISEFILYASLNYVPSKEELEGPHKDEGQET